MAAPIREKIISLRVTERQFEALEELADDEDVTISALIRQAVAEYVTRMTFRAWREKRDPLDEAAILPATEVVS